VPSADTKELRLRARFAGERIQVRAFEQGERVGLHPLTLRVGERGYAVLFRFGAVVLVDVAPVEEAAFYAQLEASSTSRWIPIDPSDWAPTACSRSRLRAWSGSR
jgi:hypothetical protein